MVNQERKQLLIDALKSGEFRQTTKSLKKEGGYCCLGVACEVYRRATGHGEWKPYADHIGALGGTEEFVISDRKGVVDLPMPVSDWFGFHGCNPAITSAPMSSIKNLAELNDIAKKSFSEIADVLENDPAFKAEKV